ncbi:acylglycerol lipase [Burkholderia lata]|uniref:alpha/beta fold hydrolase n=1 Tax=Burkholderia lata (strain ATCC 17760 / DSM 23089 / LMG 22485 / NCIMB 9086 / R18194 / 383) TaxID=482957 RepID=UPI001454040E|nr:alpha/beta fold hydrolase [Burkholderia lata]VWC41433.1 acylglycerol lipase [Burkholderia lata]
MDREHADRSFTFSSEVDEAVIHARRWLPPADTTPRGLIQITHGVCEHCGRYDRLARDLARHGYIVYALDLRAHGLTAQAGELGVAGIDAWKLMTSDIFQLGKIAKSAYPDLPLVAFGHSMGSALTQMYAQEHGDQLSGVILCGTLGSFPGKRPEEVEAMLPVLKKLAESNEGGEVSDFMFQMLASMNSLFEKSGPVTGGEWMTGDAAEQRKFFDDPLCGKLFCNRLFYSVVDGFRSTWTKDAEARIPRSLPILMICGEEDPVGERTNTVRELTRRYTAQGHLRLSYVFYPGARHEILNDFCKDAVQRDIRGWLASTLA